jgi:hypothetical protein
MTLHRHGITSHIVRLILGCALALLWLPATAAAQGSGDGFLFGAPKGALRVRGGMDRARSGSDLFAFVTEQLTVNRSDFRSGTFGVDLDIALSSRVSVVAGGAVSRSKTPSEFRDWLDNRDLPITQTTSFDRLPVTAGVKVFLMKPGVSIGRLAWVPSRIAPFVGAGAGMMRYRFDQRGDFIDFDTTRVFFDEFKSDGWTPTVHALAGVDVTLSPRFAFTTEARYEWARSALSTDFSGFDPIDLSGVKVTAGLTIRY